MVSKNKRNMDEQSWVFSPSFYDAISKHLKSEEMSVPADASLGAAGVPVRSEVSVPQTPGSALRCLGTEDPAGVCCPLLWNGWGSPDTSARLFWWQPEAF